MSVLIDILKSLALGIAVMILIVGLFALCVMLIIYLVEHGMFLSYVIVVYLIFFAWAIGEEIREHF